MSALPRKKQKPPHFRDLVINLLSNLGAEGQSRTATGLPPQCFELDATPSYK